MNRESFFVLLCSNRERRQKYCSECAKKVIREREALYRSNHVNVKKVKVSGKGSTKKNKRLCEIAKAADKAGMSYGMYVLKNGLY